MQIAADKRVPKSFAETSVTLSIEGESVTHTVSEWCDLRKIPISRVYSRRRKFNTWEESFSKPNLSYSHTKDRKMGLTISPHKVQV